MGLRTVRQLQREKAKRVAYIQAQVNAGRDFYQACAHVKERPENVVWQINFPRVPDAEE